MKKHLSLILLMAIMPLISWSQFKEVKGSDKPLQIKEEVRISNPVQYVEEDLYNRQTDEFVLKPYTRLLSPNYVKSKLSVVQLRSDGLPIAISGTIPSSKRKAVSLLDKAYEYMEEAKSLLRIDNPKAVFKPLSVKKDDLGFTHFRMRQYMGDVPVYGGEIILHAKEDVFDFLNGKYYVLDDTELITIPTINVMDAENKMRDDLGDFVDFDDHLGIFENVRRVQSELVVFLDSDGNPRLCHHFTAFPNMIERWEYFVDAHNSEIVEKFLNVCKLHNHELKPYQEDHGELLEHSTKNTHISYPEAIEMVNDGPATANGTDLLGVSRSLNTYRLSNTFYMLDGSRDIFNANQSQLPDNPVGAIFTLDAFNTAPQNENFTYDHIRSNNNTWNTPAGVSAHYNGGAAYEYFRNVHNRASINGSGGTIFSLVNVADEDGSGLDNAFWNGIAIFYGNGNFAFRPLARALDVAGHEMTHGVVQETAGLEYRNESGALNESFADVFGAMIERQNWQIGEQVALPSAFPSGALRDMSNPHNGAAFGNFGQGWQPRHYNERYVGTDNNGGVHRNSGIVNHAYYLFATNPNVGLDRAERVYYRALSQYLTKSSQFVDCRVAVVRSAQDLYGEQVVAAARAAFDAVGIMGEQSGNYQQDFLENPGDDLLVFTTEDNESIYIFTTAGQAIANPLSSVDPISRISVSDNGGAMVYVGSDKQIRYNAINWSTGNVNEQIINTTGITNWRNAIVSKDGTKIAALSDELNNLIVVFDLVTGSGNIFELFNPTFTEGVNAGDVLYADALEFDYSGEFILYDAYNSLPGQGNLAIEYWDIGVIKVWNKQANTFALPDQIEKLFPGLTGDISVGNATIAKNSPFVICFDYLSAGEYAILGYNLETGDLGLILENNTVGYPSFTKKDDRVVYDRGTFFGTNLQFVGLQSNKIIGNPNSVSAFIQGTRWATGFSNGERVLSALEDNVIADNQIKLFPSPADQLLNVMINDEIKTTNIEFQIIDSQGRQIKHIKSNPSSGSLEMQIDISDLPSGLYILRSSYNSLHKSNVFIKK
jgi:Zn-dependent metalloprotease